MLFGDAQRAVSQHSVDLDHPVAAVQITLECCRGAGRLRQAKGLGSHPAIQRGSNLNRREADDKQFVAWSGLANCRSRGVPRSATYSFTAALLSSRYAVILSPVGDDLLGNRRTGDC